MKEEWGYGAVGSAIALQAKGDEFESRCFQKKKMRKKIKKDRKRRERVEKNWKERRRRKGKRKDRRNGGRERKETEKRKKELKEIDGKRTRVRNRCVETGNPRSVIRWFRRSGLQVRERGLQGKLPGVYKKSW
jgi:small subunit ribosomal protein S14